MAATGIQEIKISPCNKLTTYIFITKKPLNFALPQVPMEDPSL